MLLIPCPWCGPREEHEFRYGGEAVPAPAADNDDRELARRLFVRSAPAGPMRERWYHVHGCRRWFPLVRYTTTHELTAPPEARP